MNRRPGRTRLALRIPAGPDAAQAGMVTAEFAVALPALVLAALTGLFAVSAVTAQLRCTSAAATASRLAGRGESAAVVRAQTKLAAPGGATVSVSDSASTVTATVTVRLRPVGLPLPALTLHATSVAPREPGRVAGGR